MIQNNELKEALEKVTALQTADNIAITTTSSVSHNIESQLDILVLNFLCQEWRCTQLYCYGGFKDGGWWKYLGLVAKSIKKLESHFGKNWKDIETWQKSETDDGDDV